MTNKVLPSSHLSDILDELGCQTGTIHRMAADGLHLELVCQTGVPEVLLDRISLIPVGKGIAGAAAATGEPVELCNLQQDSGGVAKPGARQTGVAGSIAIPLFSTDGTRKVIGTLGVGMLVPHEFTAAEKDALARHGEKIAKSFENRTHD